MDNGMGGFMGSAGESSQGMDADPAGAGLGADMSGNIFGRGIADEISAILARMGLPAAGYGLNRTQQQAYQAGFNPYDPSQQGNPFSEYTDTQWGQLPSNRDRMNTVDLTGGPPRNDYGFLANNANILGLGPNYNGIGISFPGGHPGSVGPMGLAEGGGEPYIRPRRLAYRNAYDQDDPSNFFGGM